jgi:hypothetical protein
MANKKRASAPKLEAYELDKTLLFDGALYNINAVHSDSADSAVEAGHAVRATDADAAKTALEADHAKAADHAIKADSADKIKYALTIKASNLNDMHEDTFDGSTADKEIHFVPATGGTFEGDILVPHNKASVFDKKAVLNYGDLTDVVLKELKNNSILYEWNGDTLTEGITPDNAFKSVGVITGSADNVDTFAATNSESKQFSAFIYVADDGRIYFGTSESSTAMAVTVGADTATNADKLSNKRIFSVSLDSGSTTESFDGTEDVKLGVSGILPVTKGGTGQTNLANVSVGSATNASNLVSSTITHTADSIASNFNELFNKAATNTEDITSIRTGTITVAKAAKATQDSDGKQINKNYYQCKANTSGVNTITISASAPSGGSNGDIWIKY